LNTFHEELKQLQLKQEAAVSVANVCGWTYCQMESILDYTGDIYILFCMCTVDLIIKNNLLFQQENTIGELEERNKRYGAFDSSYR